MSPLASPLARRAALVALLCWGFAAALYAASGRASVVLLFAPIAFLAGDVAAAQRRRRLTAVLDTAFRELVSSDDNGAAFRGAEARIVQRRERLVGLAPPRLQAVWIVRSAAGQWLRVRAEVPRADPDAIRWRLTVIDREPTADRPVSSASL